MTCQDVIVNLIDVLMEIFDTNKAVFKLLLSTRHKIKHLCTSEDVQNHCKAFCIENKEGISHRDITIFKNTDFYHVIDTVWDELCPENRNLIWKWVTTITRHCEN